MRQIAVQASYISLSMTGDQAPYTTGYSAKFISSTKLSLSYSISPQVIGGMNEVLTITLVDTTAFTNTNGILLSSPISLQIPLNKVAAAASVEGAGQSSSYMFLGTFAISIAAGVLAGGSMEMMWSMANTLQIIYFLGLLALYYPPHTLTVFKYIAYANFENPLFGYASQLLFGNSFFIDNPINDSFDDLGFGSTNFVANASDTIPAILLMLCGL